MKKLYRLLLLSTFLSASAIYACDNDNDDDLNAPISRGKFDALPNEIIRLITDTLENGDRENLAHTCHNINEVVGNISRADLRRYILNAPNNPLQSFGAELLEILEHRNNPGDMRFIHSFFSSKNAVALTPGIIESIVNHERIKNDPMKAFVILSQVSVFYADYRDILHNSKI